MRIRDPEIKKILIRDKHPGSATLKQRNEMLKGFYVKQ
jgi:hypothetical protein